MNCKQIDEFLDAGARGATLPTSMDLHLEVCDRCRRLVAEFRQPVDSITVPDTVTLRIAGLLTQNLDPVTPVPAPSTFSLLLIGGTIALCVAVTAALGGHALAAMSLRQLLGSAAIMGGALALLALSIGRQVIPATQQRVTPWLLWVLVLAGLGCSVAVLFPWKGASDLSSVGWRCSIRGLLIAIMSGGIAAWTIRCGLALQADLLGATVGLLAGLTGVTVLQFNCPVLEAPHILVWHVGIVIVAATAGFLVGRLWSTLRFGLRKR